MSLGSWRGERLRVQAISHSATFGREMDLLRGLEAMMAEAVDQAATVVVPAAEGAAALISRAHQALAGQPGAGALCTAPLASFRLAMQVDERDITDVWIWNHTLWH